MRLRSLHRSRRGATLVEAALTVTVFLALFVGVVDLGIFVFRSHIVAHAARVAARTAAVHGSLANSSWNGGPWGPTTFGPTTVDGSSDVKVTSVSSQLSGLESSATQITYEWPDGNNEVESRVRVTITTTWTPVYAALFGSGARTIRALSTLPIAH